jgi:hypothetical protein
MGMVEGDVGILGGTEHPFHHGDLRPKKMKSGFSKRRPISFGESSAKLRKGSKN